MTYKEELQAEKLKLEEKRGNLRCYKMRLDMSIEIIKPGRIMLGKEPVSEVMLELAEKANLELAEINQEIQKLEAEINRL